jgi:predicted MFS family arabinose efflux permease
MIRAQASLLEFRESLKLLSTRQFGTFWMASLLSNIGTWSQQVEEPWLLLSLGASPFLIGLDSFAMNAPVWLLTLIGGILADAKDRRHVITFFQSIQMLCPLAIAAMLLLHVAIHPLWIIGFSVVVGVTDALSMPSYQSIVTMIVSRDQIARGLALNSTQFNQSRILGPAIAGVLMSSFGAFACFAISATSYVPFIGVAFWVLPKKTKEAHAGRADQKQRHLVVDLKTILKVPEFRAALLTVLSTSVLCSPLNTFCPVLVSDIFKGGADRFSLAIGAFGLGGLMGALALLAVSAQQNRSRLNSLFAVIYGLVVIGCSFVPWFSGLPILMACGGCAMAVGNTSANTLIQSTSDPKLLGQASSLFMLAMRGGLPIGSLLTGLTVELLGVQQALLVNGILAVIAQLLIIYFRTRSTSRREEMQSSPRK